MQVVGEFTRMRIGIGKPVHEGKMINHVLDTISKDEKEILEKGIIKAKDAVLEILKNGVDTAMNKYN